ncbi:MAG TPA: hypothetical protein PLM56_18460 [Cyclobacteriaceae bacterium]|nr:hypothetical protein [Cytophagales bacterium]HRE65665.1 hypothetical protein [Cyclobacteriaceae bacterium]HRF35493.1 hypothetical protein [Cyclobacteriaceae bacterium]
MIISKPRSQTLISFILFLLLTFVVLGLNVMAILQRTYAWYNLLIVGILLPIGLFVLYRIFIRYKVIRAGDNRIEVTYPVLKKTRAYTIKQVTGWRESIVKTGKNSVFKELEIVFDDHFRLALAQKEHTEYDKLVQYLQRKAPGKKATQVSNKAPLGK